MSATLKSESSRIFFSFLYMLDAGIITLIITARAATVALVVKYALMSKCDNVTLFWGCCSIHRNTGQEIQQPPASPDRV